MAAEEDVITVADLIERGLSDNEIVAELADVFSEGEIRQQIAVERGEDERDGVTL